MREIVSAWRLLTRAALFLNRQASEIGAGGETCTPVEFPLQFTKLPLSLLSHAGEILSNSLLTSAATVIENGRASGYCALYSGLEDRRVSLNTYARKVTQLEPAYVGCYGDEMESRAGIAPASAVLRTAAWAARPTGLKLWALRL
jgi:hypothetical protein